MLKKTAASQNVLSSRKVCFQYSVKKFCFCLVSTVILWWGGFGPVLAAEDDPVFKKLEDMNTRLNDLKMQLDNADADRSAMDRRLTALIAGVDIHFVHYGVDANGNLTTGTGADLSSMDAARPLVIQKSENMFCAISKTLSNVRGDNSRYMYHCEVARNAQKLWSVTAGWMSICRVSCVNVELTRKGQQ
jgi:hypothetical protein